MLAKDSESSRFIYNAINKEFNISIVILEKGIDKRTLIKNRIRKLGFKRVMGQLIFQLFVVSILKATSKKQTKKIIFDNNLDNNVIESNKKLNVASINNNIAIHEIKKINPDVILVNGTRIISKKVLNSTDAVFINCHVGITPKYRGVHGAYWALTNKDYLNCGVTVHLIDEGIDTGSVIYQDVIDISQKDNFITYPLLQVSKGINLIKKTLIDLKNHNLKTHKNNLESKLWYHPTIWEYFYFRAFRKVK